tara:strand:+ start:277 stop:435 length:159 start_codon:yes stop_codon:yes gene_type:complete
MTSSTIEKIDEYYQEALASIPSDHPHKQEIKQLLIDQVNDDLHDATYSRANR